MGDLGEGSGRGAGYILVSFLHGTLTMGSPAEALPNCLVYPCLPSVIIFCLSVLNVPGACKVLRTQDYVRRYTFKMAMGLKAALGMMTAKQSTKSVRAHGITAQSSSGRRK